MNEHKGMMENPLGKKIKEKEGKKKVKCSKKKKTKKTKTKKRLSLKSGSKSKWNFAWTRYFIIRICELKRKFVSTDEDRALNIL